MYSWLDGLGPPQPGLDGRRLRQALGGYTTGACLVTAVSPSGKREGMTINSFAAVSLEPPLVLWSIRDEARSADVFLAAPHFVISVLGARQRDLAAHFARPSPDKFEAWADQFDTGLAGCPRLVDSVATFECSGYSRHKEGDHTIIIGRVERFTSSDREPPLVVHAGAMGSMFELAEAIRARGVTDE